MFLVGGPAYSGTTLLALLLNQEGITCLSEPDFHDPEQSHNGLPVLSRLHPDRQFPRNPDTPLTYRQAVDLMAACQEIIRPNRLGVKFCNKVFVDFASIFRESGLPVIAIVGDVRDSLVRPLLSYVGGEHGLVQRYRMVWENRQLYDIVLRYEDLVRQEPGVFEQVSEALGIPVAVPSKWDPENVHSSMMYPEYRHQMLKSGRLSGERVGIWRSSGKTFSGAAHRLALEMGYPPE